jgi:hypothetical protein
MSKMMQDKDISLLRGISFVFAALSYLQDDPFCNKCNAFVKSVEIAKDKFINLEKSINKNKGIPEQLRSFLLGIYTVLAEIRIPDNPIKQKKEGICHLPTGICLAKSTLAMYGSIEKQMVNKNENLSEEVKYG